MKKMRELTESRYVRQRIWFGHLDFASTKTYTGYLNPRLMITCSIASIILIFTEKHFSVKQKMVSGLRLILI